MPGLHMNAKSLMAGVLLTTGLGPVPADAASPKAEPPADISGTWSVEWCDRTNPKLDCGGFNVTLVQDGARLCGDFGGALVNLRQIDDGQVVGTVVGNTAVLAVESGRNGSISLVRAERHGDTLKWRVVDNIRKGDNGDTDVIALNDVLKRKSGPASEGTRTCGGATDNLDE